MEIGQETIGDAEAIARGDEEARLTGKRRELAVIGSRALQKPQGSRAADDDLSSPRLYLVRSFRCLRRDLAALGMHHVALGIGSPHRQECARPHMQRNEMA